MNVVILKGNSISMTEPSNADVKRISKESGKTDGKLSVENMAFYPNPNNGKFNLSS